MRVLFCKVRDHQLTHESTFVFFSETMRLDAGLIIELWNKGMLWDKLIGTHWLPLMSIKHSNQVSLS